MPASAHFMMSPMAASYNRKPAFLTAWADADDNDSLGSVWKLKRRSCARSFIGTQLDCDTPMTVTLGFPGYFSPSSSRCCYADVLSSLSSPVHSRGQANVPKFLDDFQSISSETPATLASPDISATFPSLPFPSFPATGLKSNVTTNEPISLAPSLGRRDKLMALTEEPAVPVSLNSALMQEQNAVPVPVSLKNQLSGFANEVVPLAKKRNYSHHEKRTDRKWMCTFMVGIVETPEFSVVKRVIGSGGRNMKYMIGEVPEAKIRLRGKGSGFKDQATGVESRNALQVNINCTDIVGYHRVREMIRQLLDCIYNEYAQYSGIRVEMKCLENAKNPAY